MVSFCASSSPEHTGGAFLPWADYAGEVTSNSKEDGLSWEGDDHLDAPVLPSGWKAVGKGSEPAPPAEQPASPASVDRAPGHSRTEETTSETDAVEPGLSTAALLGLGALGGVYLLYTIGWVIGGLRMQDLARLIVSDAMYVPWFIFAVAAPALWFLTTWVLTRGKATWLRLLVLLAGAVLLVPWPFVMMGALGA